MAKTILEGYEPCEYLANITDAIARDGYYACTLTTTATGLDEPTKVGLGAANAAIYGAIKGRESDGAGRVQVQGVAYFRASAAYAAAQNGTGIIGAANGLVTSSSAAGARHTIIGGGTITINGVAVNILKVRLTGATL